MIKQRKEKLEYIITTKGKCPIPCLTCPLTSGNSEKPSCKGRKIHPNMAYIYYDEFYIYDTALTKYIKEFGEGSLFELMI